MVNKLVYRSSMHRIANAYIEVNANRRQRPYFFYAKVTQNINRYVFCFTKINFLNKKSVVYDTYAYVIA